MSDKYESLVIDVRHGIGKKSQKPYKMLEVLIFPILSKVAVFEQKEGIRFEGIQRGDVVEISIDSSNPIRPFVSLSGFLPLVCVLEKAK